MKQCILVGCENTFTPHPKRLLCADCMERTRPAGKITSGNRQISSTIYSMIDKARRRNKYEVTIVEHDLYIVWPYNNRCPVFGFEFKAADGIKGCRKRSPSLDRIDPDKGYIPGNVQIISDLANKMKQNATQEELHKFADWIKK